MIIPNNLMRNNLVILVMKSLTIKESIKFNKLSVFIYNYIVCLVHISPL